MYVFNKVLCLISFTFIPYCLSVKDVIIIGGGLSGLTAARKIYRDAPTEFRIDILEARLARYGGRIWTDRIKYPKAIGLEADIGAIMFTQDGALAELVANYNFTIHKPTKTQLYDIDEAKIYSDGEVFQLFEDFYQAADQAISEFDENGKDDRLWSVLSRQFNKKKNEHIMKALFKILPISGVKDMSAAMFLPHRIMERKALLAEGTDEIVNRLASGSGKEMPLEVQLDTIVRQIKVDNVTNKVKVRTADLRQFTTDIVVISSPLGVLKDGLIEFEPPLPRPYLTAMSNIGFVNYNRLVIGFDKVFWPEDVEQFIAIRKFEEVEVDETGFLSLWINGYKFLQKPYLIGDISGEMADKIEEMSDTDLIEKALNILTEMFGEDKVSSASVTSLKRSSWGDDSFSLGAYAFPKVGCRNEDFEILSTPICPNIFFAGEHTDRMNVGSLEGAYLSGIRVAEQILSKHCDNIGADKDSEQIEKQKDEL